jgi:hypothetical protein
VVISGANRLSDRGGNYPVRNFIRLLLFTFASSLVAVAQSFVSGSTGIDGALDLTTGDRTIQLPDSGILNYTTVNIPAGKTLTFGLNLGNTPVVMLAQGAVLISGTINISGSTPTPGPGGFYGGAPLQDGFGPGAGVMSGQRNGSWIGPLSLVPIVGGSGSASPGIPGYYCNSSPGGGGGGAIVIASSVSVSVAATGYIIANPGGAGCSDVGWGFQGGAGAIRLVSNSLDVGGHLFAAVVRLEAPLSALTYTGDGTPPVRSTINPLIVPTNSPSITFSSIGGYQVPSYSGSSFSTIDLLLPSQLQDPIPVVVQATNVPVGSPVSLSFSGSIGATSTTAKLSGTTASSTATLYVSGLARSTVTYLFVLVTFDPSLVASNVKQFGPNAVARVEIASAPGKTTTYRFLRRDGTEVSLPNVHPELRRALGL